MNFFQPWAVGCWLSLRLCWLGQACFRQRAMLFFSFLCSAIHFSFTRPAAALGSARSLLCVVRAALFAHSGGWHNVSLVVADGHFTYAEKKLLLALPRVGRGFFCLAILVIGGMHSATDVFFRGDQQRLAGGGVCVAQSLRARKPPWDYYYNLLNMVRRIVLR